MCKILEKYQDNLLFLYIVSFVSIFIVTNFDTELIIGTAFFALPGMLITAIVIGILELLCCLFNKEL